MPRSSPTRSASESSRSLLKQHDGVFASEIEDPQVRAAVIQARMRRNRRNVLVNLFRSRGPVALADPRIQHFLQRLWDRMHYAPTLEERKRAKDSWIRSLTAALPNLSTVKESVDAEKLGAAAEAALAKLKVVRKKVWRDPKACALDLKNVFHDWPDPSVEELAKALMLPRSSTTIRRALFAGVGRAFHPLREWTTVRDALAEYRRARDGASRQNQTLSQPPPAQ